MQPVVLEKDLWVTTALDLVFSLPDLAEHMVFKGGTSLSKVHRVIERFSEDIDLALDPAILEFDEAPFMALSKTQKDKACKKLEKDCLAFVNEQVRPPLEAKLEQLLGRRAGRVADWLEIKEGEGEPPGLLFHYPSALSETAPYIAPFVRLEIGPLVNQVPTSRHQIEPLISAWLPAPLATMRTSVVALDVERTFWEKATILHAEYHRSEPRPVGEHFARHYSDFAQLWKHPSKEGGLKKLDLLEVVRTQNSAFYQRQWAHYETAVPGTLRLVPPADKLQALEADYEDMRLMFPSDPPPFSEILATLEEAERTIRGL